MQAYYGWLQYEIFHPCLQKRYIRTVWLTAPCPIAPSHATTHPGRRSGCRGLRQWYHYHPVFQGSLPPLPHAGDAAPIFPSSIMIPWLNPRKVLPLTSLRANISPRSSPLITLSGVPNVLCPYILIFSYQGSLRHDVTRLSGYALHLHKMLSDRPVTVRLSLCHGSHVLLHELQKSCQE